MKNFTLGFALVLVVAQAIWLQMLRRQINQLWEANEAMQQVRKVVVITTCEDAVPQGPQPWH